MNGPLNVKTFCSLVTESSKKHFLLFLRSCGLCGDLQSSKKHSILFLRSCGLCGDLRLLSSHIVKNTLPTVKRLVKMMIVLPVGRFQFLGENKSGLRFRRNNWYGGLWNAGPHTVIHPANSTTWTPRAIAIISHTLGPVLSADSVHRH